MGFLFNHSFMSGTLRHPWTVAGQASLSFTISSDLLKVLSIELVMLSKHLVLCRPLFLLPSTFSNIRVFSKIRLSSVKNPIGTLFGIPLNVVLPNRLLLASRSANTFVSLCCTQT